MSSLLQCWTFSLWKWHSKTGLSLILEDNHEDYPLGQVTVMPPLRFLASVRNLIFHCNEQRLCPTCAVTNEHSWVWTVSSKRQKVVMFIKEVKKGGTDVLQLGHVVLCSLMLITAGEDKLTPQKKKNTSRLSDAKSNCLCSSLHWCIWFFTGKQPV